jgi:hypothetical protein
MPVLDMVARFEEKTEPAVVSVTKSKSTLVPPPPVAAHRVPDWWPILPMND